MVEIKFGLQILEGSIVVCKEFMFPLWMNGNKTKLTKGDIISILKLYDAQQYTRKLDILKEYPWVGENHQVQILLKFYVWTDGMCKETLDRSINFNFSRISTGMDDVKNMVLLNFPYDLIHSLIWKYKREFLKANNSIDKKEGKPQGEKGVYVLLPLEERVILENYVEKNGRTIKDVFISLIRLLPAPDNVNKEDAKEEILSPL